VTYDGKGWGSIDMGLDIVSRLRGTGLIDLKKGKHID
jgi:hypothetical protein